MAWYVALEGAEGCGKSTQAARLALALDAVLTRETGGTPIGERLRAILHDNDVTDLADRSEALIAAADRAQHLARVVRPALDAARSIVSDRSVYSTLAYQGYGRQLDVGELRLINDWAIEGLWPTHVVLLDAPQRCSRRGSTAATSTASNGKAPISTRVSSPATGRWPRPNRSAGVWSTPPTTLTLWLPASSPRWRSSERPVPMRATERQRRSGSHAACVAGERNEQCVGPRRRTARRCPPARATSAAPAHAYLFVGPPGSTKDEAARAFAAVLLTGSHDPSLRSARLALRGEHPDVHEILRAGPAISAEQAREIIHVTALAPVEDEHKVVVLHDFHLLTADAAARLLKSIEEPPPSTTFVVLADHVPPDLITIASRCVRIDFGAIPEALLIDQLVAEGVDPATASEAAAAAAGNLDRSRLLAADPVLAERRARRSPSCLHGSTERATPSCARPTSCSITSIGPRHRSSNVRPARSPRSTPASPASANGAAGASCSRSGTGGSCDGTSPTSCEAASACSPAPIAIGWSPAAGIDPRHSSTPSPGSTSPSRHSNETPTSTSCCNHCSGRFLWTDRPRQVDEAQDCARSRPTASSAASAMTASATP